jgi:hypothetical protein
VGAQRIVLHQLGGHLPGEFRLQPALHIDTGQFAVLGHRVGLQLDALA